MALMLAFVAGWLALSVITAVLFVLVCRGAELGDRAHRR